MNLHNTKTVEWDARTTLEPLVSSIRCLRFDLVNNAHSESRWYDDSFWPSKVLSVTDATGAPLPFMHKKDQLLVILPAALNSGQKLELTSKGSADMIYQVTAESFGLIPAHWYPQYGYNGGRCTFHWTIRVPRPFTVTGSGRLIREFEDAQNNQNGIEIATDVPVTHPWVIFGKFHRSEDTYLGEESKKSVKISIHTSSIQGSGLPEKKVQDFFTEGKDILKLYENIYGPYPYEELHIAQMGPDLGFGQGPPYFVQLTGELFLPGQSFLGQYSVHDFLSHEISHQWWGNQVGWASDDDVWLSEGFASYAAGVWIQALQKKAGLQRMLDEWRMDAKVGDKEAPIVAASMLEGPNADDFRTKLLYSKSPYVLHMLRIQLDDEKYKEVMRGIHSTYKNQDISTEMLLREINRVTAQDYTYFFEQWIWDVGVPRFHYSWQSARQPDGKFLITVHVSQEDKNHLKRVLMPIYIHAKGSEIPPQYKGVVQAEQDIKLMCPVEPKDVTLDDDHTLLADILKAG
jgi:peptidase M1-like protein